MRTVADSLIEQGMQQSTREDIFEVLEARFEVAPQSLIKRFFWWEARTEPGRSPMPWISNAVGVIRSLDI